MSKYKINSLNKITTGNSRTFISLNIKKEDSDEKDSFDKIYECEDEQTGDQLNVVSTDFGIIKPIYDASDVHFKSMSSIKNDYILNLDKDSPSKTEDIFIPKNSNPKVICQLDSTTFLLTEETYSASEMLSSTLNETRNKSTYSFNVRNNEIKTYLFKDCTYECKPTVNLRGILYNYLAQIPMSDINSEYKNGNIYCSFFNTKNQYDSVYSMNMVDSNTLSCARQYFDVMTCGGKVYLKYYDNIEYSSNNEKIRNGILTKNMTKQSVGTTYQKIEEISPIIVTTGGKHKTPFFSINIKDFKNNSSNEKQKNIIENIKHDIKTAIKEIARNVTPSQTQLFDVYFGKEEK